MLPETLVGLACLIASGGTLDEATASKLSSEEVLAIQELVQTNVCLPENAERLLQETRERIKSGQVSAAGMMRPAPTTESF